MTHVPTLALVAMSVPIVYNDDGEHDPDGMLFAMRGHAPLLRWLRSRWEDDDGRLPRLHLRRQRYQLLADGLTRLELMLTALRDGPAEDLDLLADLIREEHVAEFAEPQDRDRASGGTATPRARAVRANVTATLTDIRVALADLGRSAAPARPTEDLARPLADAAATPGDGVPAGEPVAGDVGADLPAMLVGLAPGERAALLRRCREQLVILHRAIERWFADVEADPQRRFDAEALAAQCRAEAFGWAGSEGGSPQPFGADEVRRLMLNSHSRPHGPGRGDHDRVDPMRPVPLVRPLTVRTRLGECVDIEVENRLSRRPLGFHVQGDGLGLADGLPAETVIPPRGRRRFRYASAREGIWPIADVADVRGGESGTNARGLFGALVVEPAGVTWHDPQTGADQTASPFGSGLYVDIHVPGEPDPTSEDAADYVDLHRDGLRSHREYAVYIHDEPQIHSGLHATGEHTVMPLSYRAEPMHARLPHRMRRLVDSTPPHPHPDQRGVDRTAVTMRLGDELDEQFWTARTPDGRYLERVSGEEQHHSSWLFGDPATPILNAYAGDPARVRLVHAGVKETHVWHLHVHQWRLIPQDGAPPSVHGCDAQGRPLPKGSQIVDAVTIGPQTSVTIDPLYGSGSRAHAVGDIIWHCHLYPHFHHGMWGLWRSFDRLLDDSRTLPDGRPCPALQPLPGRTPPAPEPGRPGFPWFIDGDYPMKSPPPPATSREQRCGRRVLLGMPAASDAERAAMAPACADGSTPGSLFVDLDGLARRWNADAGLPPPRVVSYDVQVLADRIAYNVDGWHDPRGHRYRLLAASITDTGPDGRERIVRRRFEPDGANPEPFFPRANLGDIVELRLHNALTSAPADGFDLAQAPVECGLHVHLVKFDVLGADGSSTGWNYLSGASCREAVGADLPGERSRTTSLHRWVADEEFGPCFFHDHLLANYRQKHGLFAALVVQPPGSQWYLPSAADPTVVTGSDGTDTCDRTDDIAWSEPAAVIVPPAGTGVPPYREACLGVGDFVPLLDRGGRPLNPPGALSGDDDPGSMAVNYRSAPLTFRGKDPSRWFSTAARSRVSFHGTPGDPDTPLIELYPGERLRIRLIQGSHEEQHSFVASGLRWRRDWGNAASPLVNQQTLGISEAFTLDVDPAGDCPTGLGDHLWRFAPIDDLWTGCWGYVRILRPGRDEHSRLAPLPRLRQEPAPRELPARPTGGDSQAGVRTHLVVARRTEHRYAGTALTDPWGLVLRAAEYRQTDHDNARRTGRWPDVPDLEGDGPLVLRARRGEWVRLVLVNELIEEDSGGPGEEPGQVADVDVAPEPDSLRDWPRLPQYGVEPSPPRLPLEHLDDLGRPDRRTVSPRVGLHPSLLLRDVRTGDGSAVGRNPDQTVAHRPLSREEHDGHGAPGQVVVRGHDGPDDHGSHDDEPNFRELWWYADEALAPASHLDGPGQVCFLEDLADVRDHRHHGLFGALVVLPGDVTPVAPDDRSTPAWTGTEADILDADGTLVAHDATVSVQDGLRLFVNGHPDLPVPDVQPEDDPEDSGHKGLSYRSAAVQRGHWPGGDGDPLVTVSRGTPLWLRVLGAGDKPRQHSLTLHGHAWAQARYLPDGPWGGAVSGIAPGFADTLVIACERVGDFPLRSGAYRWSTELGLWGTVRVTEDPHT